MRADRLVSLVLLLRQRGQLSAVTLASELGVSTRTVLRQVLAANGLTFVVKDQVIQVVDVEKARNMLTTRVYYLGDVVQGVGPFAGAAQWGPFLDHQQTMANIDAAVGLKWAWLAKPAIDLALSAVGFLLSRHWVYRR